MDPPSHAANTRGRRFRVTLEPNKWKTQAILPHGARTFRCPLRLRNLVSTAGGSAGVDAHTTAGLEAGATFRSSQNHSVTALGYVFSGLSSALSRYEVHEQFICIWSKLSGANQATEKELLAGELPKKHAAEAKAHVVSAACPAWQLLYISDRVDGLHIGPVFGVVVFCFSFTSRRRRRGCGKV
jgi:hypothetical protein